MVASLPGERDLGHVSYLDLRAELTNEVAGKEDPEGLGKRTASDRRRLQGRGKAIRRACPDISQTLTVEICMTTTKIVVTHGGKLRKKYKTAGWTKIKAALKRLIAADAARDIATTVVELDTLTPAKAVTNKPKTFKAAIDQAFLAYNRPDYVLILGGPDVVPHQPLLNPLFDPKGEDWDKTVPSDSPYACDAPDSTAIEDFLGPSRVVGRLPDLPRATKPQLLVGLIDLAAKATESPAAGTRTSACRAWSGRLDDQEPGEDLRAGSKPRLSPTEGPVWTKAALGPGWHFINCHGAPKDPQFYGQDGEDYPCPTTRPSCR